MNQNQHVVTEDYTFEFVQAGSHDGVPALLLHGFPGSLASWHPLLPLLAQAGMQPIAVNQRGYSPGARPPGVDDYGIEHLVDDVLKILNTIGWDRVHLIGHDWGAVVAWFVAAQHPHRLHSLTALSIPHPRAFGHALTNDPAQREGSAYIDLLCQPGKAEDVLLADGARRLQAMFEFEPPVPQHLVEAHLDVLSERSALTAALNWYRAPGHHGSVSGTRALAGLGSQLSPVPVPTTYIWGAKDAAMRRVGAERCADFVTGDYRFVELADIGHWIPEQAPRTIAQEVLARL